MKIWVTLSVQGESEERYRTCTNVKILITLQTLNPETQSTNQTDYIVRGSGLTERISVPDTDLGGNIGDTGRDTGSVLFVA